MAIMEYGYNRADTMIRRHSVKITYPNRARILLFLIPMLSANTSVTRADIWTGTILLASLSETSLVIGADSKQTGGGTATGRDRLGCKIIQVNATVFASTGVGSYEGTGFNAQALFKATAKNTSSLKDISDEFNRAITEPFERAVLDIAAKYPDDFERNIKNKTGLQVMMGGWEGSIPVLYTLQLFVESSASGIRVRPSLNRVVGKTPPALLMGGEKDAASNYLEKNPAFEKEEPVKVIKKLIEVEIATGNPKVGPPIDIVRITKDGIEWIQRKPECSDGAK
jgi:hypothetical protein